MSKRQNATIKEVAEQAGVSQMTVSRVLNQRSLVKETTRLKVEAAIEALNYRPNMLARGLAGGKSMLIGLVYFNPSSGYLSELLVGALQTCRELGHHLMLEDLSEIEDGTDTSEIAMRLRKIGLDGLILTPPLSANKALIKLMHDAGVPTVLVSHEDPSGQFSSVVFDDTAAAHSMTEYLIACGHKRIGFITGPDQHPSSLSRKEGFERAMGEHDLEIDTSLVVEGDFTFRSGMEWAEQLLNKRVPPTAIFASNDDMAAGVIAAAHRRALKVPLDLSVVGFDDTAISAAIWPRLTTVRQPISEIARRAVKLLSDGNKAEAEVAVKADYITTVDIVERESVTKLS
ncbi:MAG: LacI family DNA-binding transcriptional regulator [Hyphomonadaceae bacterium]|nr:LacI family DNA-binding transcriptional regulator [Hyphomonadaceae bacterium]